MTQKWNQGVTAGAPSQRKISCVFDIISQTSHCSSNGHAIGVETHIPYWEHCLLYISYMKDSFTMHGVNLVHFKTTTTTTATKVLNASLWHIQEKISTNGLSNVTNVGKIPSMVQRGRCRNRYTQCICNVTDAGKDSVNYSFLIWDTADSLDVKILHKEVASSRKIQT